MKGKDSTQLYPPTLMECISNRQLHLYKWKHNEYHSKKQRFLLNLQLSFRVSKT